MTDLPNTVRFARRFVVRRPGLPDVHGVQFPSGTCIADDPGSGGLIAASSIDGLCEHMTEYDIDWEAQGRD